MGNPGLYTFSYLYLVGTVHYQSFQQLEQTFFVLVFAYLLLAFVYHVKHKIGSRDYFYTDGYRKWFLIKEIFGLVITL